MADDKKPDEGADDAPAKSGGGVVPLILGVLNLLVTGGLAAAIFLGLGPSSPGTAAPADQVGDGGVPLDENGKPIKPKEEDEGPGPLVQLDDFVVQLRNPEFDRYVRVRFHVEVKDDDYIADIEKNAPIIRDDFIRYLSDRTFEELRGSQGLKRTKEELFQHLITVIPPEKVNNLLITKFVVQ